MARLPTLTVPLVLALSACSTEVRCGLDGCAGGESDGAESLTQVTASDGNLDGGGSGSGTGPEELEAIPIVSEPGRPTARAFVARIASGASCPAAPPGWVLAEAPVVSSEQVTALMSRYCAYHLPSGIDTPASLPSLHAPAGVVERVEAEPARLLTQGSTAGPGAGTTLVTGTGAGHHAELRAGLGARFVAGASNIDDDLRPYVAVIDTADPEAAWPGAPREHHGLVMGGIVSTVRCPDADPSCDRERILYQQAFSDTLATAGGDIEARGSVWSLNLAVLAAIERWRTLAGGDVPLVLNMSVGWDWGPDDTEFLGSSRDLLTGGPGRPDLSPAEQALFVSLAWASCQRVVAVAAAGNTRGGACSETGPMAPAAWESVKAPTYDECAGLLDPDDLALLGPEAAYQPNRLAYAVGGIDAADRPIVNARPESQPPRVLYSTMASVPTKAGHHTTPWTGTSVATAAFSGLVAQVWGMAANRGMGPAEVVHTVTQAGSDVDAGTMRRDPDGDASIPRIQAQDVLPSLYEAWTPTLVPPPLATVGAGGGVVSPGASAVVLAADPDHTQSCMVRTIEAYAYGGAQSSSGAPWPELSPQPNSPICPGCPLTISSTDGAALRVEVDSDYRSQPVGTTAVLELHLPQGQITRVGLDLQQACEVPSGTLDTPGTLDLSSCELPLSGYSHPLGITGQTLSDYVVGADVRSAVLAFIVGSSSGGTQLVGNEIDVFHR